jgi:predicted transposase YbfD/YdcC
MSEYKCTTMSECIAGVPDWRKEKGKRFEWSYLLMLIVSALMAGQHTLTDMMEWLTSHEDELVARLQPRRRQMPSLSTLWRTLVHVDIETLEARVAAYMRYLDESDPVPGSVLTQAGERLQGQALDGKTICGASTAQEKVHLVSVVRHESATVLAQTQVPKKRDERAAAKLLFARVPLAGRVTTLDALHTQRWEARQILAEGGHYLMVVKANQRLLYEDIQLAFSALPPTTACEQEFWAYERHETMNRGHGRWERRTLESTTALNEYVEWPGVAQVLRRTCWRQDLSTQAVTQEMHFGITSLNRHTVTLAHVEQFWRWHWTIENGLHYIRDVSMGEDASRLRTGHAPQALAIFRNALISLLRSEGWSFMPNAFRHYRKHVQNSLHLLGAIAK